MKLDVQLTNYDEYLNFYYRGYVRLDGTEVPGIGMKIETASLSLGRPESTIVSLIRELNEEVDRIEERTGPRNESPLR